MEILLKTLSKKINKARTTPGKCDGVEGIEYLDSKLSTYLDDNDTKHLVKLQSEKDLNFFRERFTVLSSEYRYE